MSNENYHDIDGKPCSLEKLCRTSPEWAANRIRALITQVSKAEDRVAELEVELRLTVTTAYHDGIVAEATKQLVVKDERIAELEEAIRQALDARRINKHPKALAVQRILEKAIGELE